MLKPHVQRPRPTALQRGQQEAIQPSVTPLAVMTLDRRTVQGIVEKLSLVADRFKARELSSVLHILEQELRKANEQ